MPPSIRVMTRSECRAADARAATLLGLPTTLLMENAGRQLSSITIAEARRYGMDSVVVIAGGGNNGGDGFVAARHLAVAGIPTRIFLAIPRANFEGDSDSARNLRAALACGIPVLDAIEGRALEAAALSAGGRPLLVDAVMGTGLEGPVRGPLEGVLRWMRDGGRPVVAADLPSGLDADTGEAWGPVPSCVATATFLGMKRGLTLGKGPALAGRIRVCDIGVPPERVMDALPA